ncbi:MAG: flagellar hook-basal body complex protein FliE [Alteromonadaceae bacterium]|nr:MAG: flagellar hook-basal body complex protein FliE [Alteromonadaceae bacterium]
MTGRTDVNSLLLEMRAMKLQSQAFGGLNGDVAHPNPLQRPQQSNGPSFTDVMSQAVNKVNDVQHATGDIHKAYLHGDPNVDVTDVMIASQKAGIAFQSLLQVRNKLVESYREIMSMPL